jgi:hypothetical protein
VGVGEEINGAGAGAHIAIRVAHATYWMPMRRYVLLLALILAVSAGPAFADLINVELTVSYFPPADFPADSHFVGRPAFTSTAAAGMARNPSIRRR